MQKGKPSIWVPRILACVGPLLQGQKKGGVAGDMASEPAQGTGNLLMSYLDTDELIFREVRQEEGKQVRLRLVFPIRSKGCWDRRF